MSSILIVFILASMTLLTTSCRIIGKEAEFPPQPTLEPEPTWTAPPPVIDTGLAYGIPCKPPCWQGLIPGKTTQQESSEILEELVVNKQIDRFKKYATGIRINIISDTLNTIFIDFEDGILKRIRGSVKFYYPIKSLIEQFSPPEGLYLIDEGSSISQRSCEEWTPPKPITLPVMSDPVHLLYPKLGLHFVMLQPMLGNFICPEMQTVYFCYYEPLSMPEALQDNYLADLCGTPKATERELVKWHGFGDGY